MFFGHPSSQYRLRWGPPPPGISLLSWETLQWTDSSNIDLCTYDWKFLLKRTNHGISSGTSLKRRGCGNDAVVKRDTFLSFRECNAFSETVRQLDNLRFLYYRSS